jgi:transposase
MWWLSLPALDDVRRAVWNDMRALDDNAAKRFKDARWSLMKNPDNLTDKQTVTLRRLKRRGGDLWRAYRLKESCRAIFSGDLDADEVEELLDRLISQAQRSRLEPFVKLAKTATTGTGSSPRSGLASTTVAPRASTMSFA